jgi:hypothetical protein
LKAEILASGFHESEENFSFFTASAPDYPSSCPMDAVGFFPGLREREREHNFNPLYGFMECA